LKLHIVSYNDFPTAAGLASSAAGFAALVYTVATLYKLTLSPSELSAIARQGSGSACRSLFGGFVAWEMGSKEDGSDSLAVEVAPREHWPEMHAAICVVSDAKKGTSSTSGMQRTVATSPFLQHRIQSVVPERMARMTAAILAKDFDAFAELTMRDSNSFHACCLDTDPPIFYMNDISKSIIALVTELNRASLAAHQGYVAAYTFDAGPNAVIYTLQKDVKTVLSLLARYFPKTAFKDRFGLFPNGLEAASVPFKAFSDGVIGIAEEGAVKEIIHTCVGDGPRVLAQEASLMGPDGRPKAS
jgi:diphosphomevalonate decarboxylase